MPTPAIDRTKLRAAIRRLGNEYVFYMLDDAIELLPEEYAGKVVAVVDKFVRFDRDKYLAVAKRVATAEPRNAL